MEKKKYKIKIGIITIIMSVLFLIFFSILVTRSNGYITLENLGEEKWKAIKVFRDIIGAIYRTGGLVILVILTDDLRQKKITIYEMYIILIMIYACNSIVAIPISAFSHMSYFFPFIYSGVTIIMYATAYLVVTYLLKKVDNMIFK